MVNVDTGSVAEAEAAEDDGASPPAASESSPDAAAEGSADASPGSDHV